jgi:hypothetical protein
MGNDHHFETGVMMGQLFVYSGQVRLCEVGIPTNRFDESGKEFFTGDIVIIYTVQDCDGGFIDHFAGLTCVVCDQFGESLGRATPKDFYIMGIAEAFKNPLTSPKWRWDVVKRHDLIVEGEVLSDYGFSFRGV